MSVAAIVWIALALLDDAPLARTDRGIPLNPGLVAREFQNYLEQNITLEGQLYDSQGTWYLTSMRISSERAASRKSRRRVILGEWFYKRVWQTPYPEGKRPWPVPFVGGEVPGGFPMLNRMCDPYRDTEYAHAELPLLMADLQKAQMAFSAEPEVRDVFHHFESACRDAINGGHNLYVEGD